MMETGTANLACKSGITKGKLWKFMTGQKPEFQTDKRGIQSDGTEICRVWGFGRPPSEAETPE